MQSIIGQAVNFLDVTYSIPWVKGLTLIGVVLYFAWCLYDCIGETKEETVTWER
jgi:hypothetical protein